MSFGLSPIPGSQGDWVGAKREAAFFRTVGVACDRMTGPIQKHMTQNQSCRVAVLAGVWAGIVLSARADPQVSGSASLTPATLTAGDTAVFAFTFSNSDAPESSAMTSSQLQVQWSPLPVNGVATRLPLLSLNAAGGSAGFVFDGEGHITGVNVTYGALAAGASRTFSASFQVPEGGLADGSVLQASATLTWPEPPGTLSRNASATVQAAPFLQVALSPVPPFTAPGGRVSYRAHAMNLGSGVARQAWMVAPVPPSTRLARVDAAAGSSGVWFSSTAYSLSQANSREFIQSHFYPGIVDENGTPADPSDDEWIFLPGARTLAVLLDDPDLNLFPSGTTPLNFTWQVEDQGSPEGTVIEQAIGYFSDEIPALAGYPQTTTIRELPAEVRLTKSEDGVRVTFFGDPEATYRIGRSGDLDDWSDLGPVVPIQWPPGIFEFHDPDPLTDRGFYRVSDE